MVVNNTSNMGSGKPTLFDMFNPRSIRSRVASIAIFFLSLLLFAAGLGVYNTSSLPNQAPYDDMGGESDWTERMMVGFVSSRDSDSLSSPTSS